VRVGYFAIEATREGVPLAHRRVDCDRGAIVAELARLRHPSAGYISGFMRGEHPPPWGG
jgi:hypothetical protein